MNNAAAIKNNDDYDLQNLPVWDLSDFYKGLDDDDAINRDFKQIEQNAESFNKTYYNKVANLSGDELAKAIAEYEAINELGGKIASFAYLKYAENMECEIAGAFLAKTQDKLRFVEQNLIFFTLEINKIDDSSLNNAIKDSDTLKKYQPWIDDIREQKPYELSEEQEKLLVDMSAPSGDGWVRLFDESIASFRFDFDGKNNITGTELSNYFSDPDAEIRKSAAQLFGNRLGENIKLFTRITNNLAKAKEIEDRWRGYQNPMQSRHIANLVEDEVVDALEQAVADNFANISHRYYALKAKWLGKDKLHYSDRNAPLPEAKQDKTSWNDAVDLVLSSYHKFSPELAGYGKKFFDNDWIHAKPQAGKDSGAFAHPTVPSVHPYLLVNYQGKNQDIMTLAHELGHGVHQLLSAPQGYFLADTPLTLAETASVFGEQLTFRGLLSNAQNDSERKSLLAKKVEDMINTVIRQIAFYRFEKLVHNARKERELSSDELCDFWLSVQEESLGDAVDVSAEEYRYYWSYIPHFIHSPFYVYAYSFGDCLVNALYSVYQSGEVDNFEQKYLQMLAAGGSLRHKELLAPFGLDATIPSFWQKGLSVISGMIDELEKIDD